MTGEMHASEVTPENFPVHFAAAKEFDGEVHPFDQYQGPYVTIADKYSDGAAKHRYFLYSDDGVRHCWIDASAAEHSPSFTMTRDQNELILAGVAAFRDLIENGGTEEPDWKGLIIDGDGTLALLQSLSSYITADDAGLPREQFLRLVADRIDDDLPERPQATPERTRPVYVLVWQDNIDLTVETHATEAAALDSARMMRKASPKINARRPFRDVADLNRYMERNGVAGGIYPRSIPI